MRRTKLKTRGRYVSLGIHIGARIKCKWARGGEQNELKKISRSQQILPDDVACDAFFDVGAQLAARKSCTGKSDQRVDAIRWRPPRLVRNRQCNPTFHVVTCLNTPIPPPPPPPLPLFSIPPAVQVSPPCASCFLPTDLLSTPRRRQFRQLHQKPRKHNMRRLFYREG